MYTLKKIWRMGLACVFNLLMFTHAMAAMPLDRGWYLEGNLGTSDLNNINFGPGTSTTTKNSGFSWNINGGYKFFPYFGLEIGYTRFSTFNITYQNATVAKDEPYDYDITTKAILPIQDSGFSFYAKMGVARVSSKIVVNDQQTINENGLSISSGYTYNTGLLYGVGGEYYFTPFTSVHVSWVEVSASNTTGNLAMTSVGVTHLFG